MEIAIASYFHNAERYVQRYFDQMALLQQALEVRGDSLYLVLGVGDCTDDTERLVRQEMAEDFNGSVVDVTHGGKVYGSVVDKERFKQLAAIGNKLWSKMYKKYDIIGLIESDLSWQPESILRLIDGVVSLEDSLQAPTLLAPMVKVSKGQKSAFYDTWAFRCNGRNFSNRWPYHPHLRQPVEYLQMDSVGSCFMMNGAVGRQLSWPEKDVVVGFCHKASTMGVKILLDTQAEVYHRD